MNLSRVTASLLACSALAVPAFCQGKPFNHALPAGTLAFFSVPDLDTSVAEFQQTALAKMWRESEVQEFVADAKKMGLAKWAEGLAKLEEMNKAGQFPIAPADLLALRVHSLSGALTSMQVKMGPNNPEPRIGIVLHMNLGESAATWRKLANMGIQSILQNAGEAVKKSETKLEGDVELITLTPPETEMSLNLAFVGKSVVIGSIQQEVKDVVSAIVGQKTILPLAAVYQATAKNLDTAGAEMEVFVNVGALLDVAMTFLKIAEKEAPRWPEVLSVAGIERAVDALGLRSIRTVGMTTRYEGNKSVTRSFALAPEASRKGIFAGTANNLDLGFLKWVPKDAASVSATTMSMGDIYNALIAAIKAYNPQQADQMLQMLAQQEKQLGISLKDDLFGVFGDQMVWWSMGVQNFMSAPEGALLMKIKDQDRLLKTLNKMAEMSRGMIEFPSNERKGIKTWRLEINPEAIDPQVAGALSFLQPCFAFKNGYMVMALATGDVRKAFKRMDRADEATTKDDIRSNKEFSGYVASVQQENVSAFSWTDWKASFENLYSAATSVLGFAVSADEVPFDLTLLPEAETLSQHLFSSATWSSCTKDGFRSKSISPMGPEIMIGAIAIGAGAGAAVFGMRTQGPMPARAQPVRKIK